VLSIKNGRFHVIGPLTLGAAANNPVEVFKAQLQSETILTSADNDIILYADSATGAVPTYDVAGYNNNACAPFSLSIPLPTLYRIHFACSLANAGTLTPALDPLVQVNLMRQNGANVSALGSWYVPCNGSAQPLGTLTDNFFEVFYDLPIPYPLPGCMLGISLTMIDGDHDYIAEIRNPFVGLVMNNI